jgi:hypothetical protein
MRLGMGVAYTADGREAQIGTVLQLRYLEPRRRCPMGTASSCGVINRSQHNSEQKHRGTD